MSIPLSILDTCLLTTIGTNKGLPKDQLVKAARHLLRDAEVSESQAIHAFDRLVGLCLAAQLDNAYILTKKGRNSLMAFSERMHRITPVISTAILFAA